MQTDWKIVQARLSLASEHGLRLIGRRWRLVVAVVWLIVCVGMLYRAWGQVRGFMLADTDDNMRMSQVRALLAGQDWFDLRQYKLDPPIGANIHWSRIVDLPIAGLILALRPLIGGAGAERTAVAIAPLLPLLPLMAALAVIARRLIDPLAYPLALFALIFAGATMGMFLPTRIDHHGWQLALLAIGVAGLVDPRAARGGAVLGLASAVSLSIGLEMIIYIAIGGAATVLFWVDRPDQRQRLAAFAVTLSGGCALGFALFASYANRAAVCDALSPVWLSDVLVAGALTMTLSLASAKHWSARLGLAAAAGVVIAVFHAVMWPHCLSRLEGVSPQVTALWLSHVREARPIYTHGWRTVAEILSLPVAGLIGYAMLGWKWRGDQARRSAVAAIAFMTFVATALLFWQTRTGPAAQMLAIPGAAAIAFFLAPQALASNNSVLRVLGTTAGVLIGLGALVPTIIGYIPSAKATPRERAIGRANSQCPQLWAMKPVALQPKGVVFTFVDLAPRLITVTHHDSVAGPYHRNGPAIGDSMLAFRGSAEQAHMIFRRHHADYVLTCPDMSVTTIFMAETPKGFYGQLSRGQVPAWLAPIPLPKGNPLRMYRITS